MTERQTFDDTLNDPRDLFEGDDPIVDASSDGEQPEVEDQQGDLSGKDEIATDGGAEDKKPSIFDPDAFKSAVRETVTAEMRALMDMQKQDREEARAYRETQTTAQKIADAKAREEAAAQSGDVQAFRDAVIEQARLEAGNQPADKGTKQPEQPQMDPHAAAFIQANSWFNTDHIMKGAAIAAEQAFRTEGYSGQALYKKVGEAMRENFPAKFESPAQRSKVEGGGRRSSGGAIGVDDLNAAERSAAKDYADDFADSAHGGDRAKAISSWIKQVKGSKK